MHLPITELVQGAMAAYLAKMIKGRETMRDFVYYNLLESGFRGIIYQWYNKEVGEKKQ